MCMHSILVGGRQQATFLIKAMEMGLTSGQYVFLPYDTLHYSVPYANVSYPPLHNDSRLREAYDAVLTITVASEPWSFNEAFTDAKKGGELAPAMQPEEVGLLRLVTESVRQTTPVCLNVFVLFGWWRLTSHLMSLSAPDR